MLTTNITNVNNSVIGFGYQVLYLATIDTATNVCICVFGFCHVEYM